MQAFLDALQRKFKMDVRLRKTGRILIDTAKESTIHPHVMVEAICTDNLDTFEHDIKTWDVTFTARAKSPDRSKIESLLANLRRVYDDLVESFAGVNISGMFRVGGEVGAIVEGSSGLWQGTLDYEVFVERVLAEGEAIP